MKGHDLLVANGYICVTKYGLYVLPLHKEGMLVIDTYSKQPEVDVRNLPIHMKREIVRVGFEDRKLSIHFFDQYLFDQVGDIDIPRITELCLGRSPIVPPVRLSGAYVSKYNKEGDARKSIDASIEGVNFAMAVENLLSSQIGTGTIRDIALYDQFTVE